MPWISFKVRSDRYQLVYLIVTFSIHIQAAQSMLTLADAWKLCFSEIKCYLGCDGGSKGGNSGAERRVKVQHLRPSCFLNLQSQAGSRINEWCSLMFPSKPAAKLAGSLRFCADVSRIQIIWFLGIMTIGGTVLPWEKEMGETASVSCIELTTDSHLLSPLKTLLCGVLIALIQGHGIIKVISMVMRSSSYRDIE